MKAKAKRKTKVKLLVRSLADVDTDVRRLNERVFELEKWLSQLRAKDYAESFTVDYEAVADNTYEQIRPYAFAWVQFRPGGKEYAYKIPKTANLRPYDKIMTPTGPAKVLRTSDTYPGIYSGLRWITEKVVAL